MDHAQLLKNMSHHKPSVEVQDQIAQLRAGYQLLANLLDNELSMSRAASIAQTDLESSLMWAVKSLVVPGA